VKDRRAGAVNVPAVLCRGIPLDRHGVILPKELSAKRPMLSAKQFQAVRNAASLDSSAAETFVVVAQRVEARNTKPRDTT